MEPKDEVRLGLYLTCICLITIRENSALVLVAPLWIRPDQHDYPDQSPNFVQRASLKNEDLKLQTRIFNVITRNDDVRSQQSIDATYRSIDDVRRRFVRDVHQQRHRRQHHIEGDLPQPQHHQPCQTHLRDKIRNCTSLFVVLFGQHISENENNNVGDGLVDRLCRTHDESLYCLHIAIMTCPPTDEHLQLIAERIGYYKSTVENTCRNNIKLETSAPSSTSLPDQTRPPATVNNELETREDEGHKNKLESSEQQTSNSTYQPLQTNVTNTLNSITTSSLTFRAICDLDSKAALIASSSSSLLTSAAYSNAARIDALQFITTLIISVMFSFDRWRNYT